MQLSINDYLGNNKVRLEYANTPSKPRYAPAYIISGKRADEFVQKYNEQSKTLVNNSILMTISGLIIGGGAALSKNSRPISVMIKSCIGGIIGLIAGIGISKHEKNKLMDKYHVEQY
mgnify:CR=1 FL=1